MPELINRFFRQALRQGTLPHGLVFKGENASALYDTALKLAQRLNCQQPNADWDSVLWGACGACRSCHWTQANAHPAVLTVSRLTGLVDEKDEEYLTQEQLTALARKKTEQTQIKTSQVGRLIRQVSQSSDDNRVVIFTDAEALPTAELTEEQKTTYPAPSEWRPVDGRETMAFVPRPLNRALMNAQSANRFLKTLEEPPPGVVIIFLVRSEQDILETLVSRCQVLPFPAGEKAIQLASPPPHDGVTPAAERLIRAMQQQEADPFALVSELNAMLEENHLPLKQLLLSGQQQAHKVYLSDRRALTPQVFNAYHRTLNRLEDGLKMTHAKVQPDRVLEFIIL